MPAAPADDRRDALADLLALVSSAGGADEASQRGLEFIAAAVGAEFGAIVRQGSVVASRGFRAGDVPIVALVAIAESRANVLAYSSFQTSELVAVQIVDEPGTRIVLANVGHGFSNDDGRLVHALGRVLALAVRMLQRPTLLE